MPIYEYTCRDCQQGFEQIVLSRDEEISCPKCRSTTVEKQLSIFSPQGSRAEPSRPSVGCGCTPQNCGCH